MRDFSKWGRRAIKDAPSIEMSNCRLIMMTLDAFTRSGETINEWVEEMKTNKGNTLPLMYHTHDRKSKKEFLKKLVEGYRLLNDVIDAREHLKVNGRYFTNIKRFYYFPFLRAHVPFRTIFFIFFICLQLVQFCFDDFRIVIKTGRKYLFVHQSPHILPWIDA